MSSTISGGVSLSCSINVAVAPGTNLAGYTIPVNPQGQASYSAGTGASQASKVYQASLSLAAAVTSLDLTTVVCVDGTTGFSHVREVIIFNDSATDGQTITLDNVSNTITGYWLGGTTPTTSIQAGTNWRQSKPLGSAGWVVNSTNKILALDPGAATIACRVVILGD